jgi:uncharacterized RDD family membrane protein YckC
MKQCPQCKSKSVNHAERCECGYFFTGAEEEFAFQSRSTIDVGTNQRAEGPEQDVPIGRSKYGGFWIRVGAYCVDCVVMLIPTLLVSFLLRATSRPEERGAIGVIDWVAQLMISWIYNAVLLSSPWQATIGKRVCGLRVVDLDSAPISFGRASGRYFASIVSTLLLGLGFLAIVWTKKRQGLHDLLAETVVVRTKPWG